MKVISGQTYFDKNIEQIKQYPYLNKNITTDLVIVGGGIQGAILNFYLSQKYKVTLVEAKQIGKQSTSIATALLEFQLDNFASELKKYLSEQDIINVYNMGKQSLIEIEKIINKYGNNCNYHKRPTFLYSNKNKDVKKIKNEYIFRQKHNFACKYYDQTNNPFCFDIKAGIFDETGGAEFNPYLFTKQMIENSNNQTSIYENTTITKISNQTAPICITNFGYTIKAKKVILATGFNSTFFEQNVKNLLTMQVSYTIVTNPVNFNIYKNSLIQDCLTNYHYFRKLPDGRIIFGGEDTKLKNSKKYNKLFKNLNKLLKNCKNITKKYQFCGIFATTKNNLGIIGEGKNPNILYFLSCGANGIVNSFCGVKIIEDILSKKHNNMAKYFSPLRKN